MVGGTKKYKMPVVDMTFSKLQIWSLDKTNPLPTRLDPKTGQPAKDQKSCPPGAEWGNRDLAKRPLPDLLKYVKEDSKEAKDLEKIAAENEKTWAFNPASRSSMSSGKKKKKKCVIM